MLDELATWGHRPPLICADAGYGAGYGEITDFRRSLTERDIPHVVAVKPSTSVYQGDAKPELMDYTGRGPRPRTTRYQQAPSSVKDVAGTGEKFAEITWRHGTKTRPGHTLAAMTSRFTALRVRPANPNIPKHPDGSLPECRLIAQWPADAAEPTDYWLSTLPQDTPPAELVRLAKIRWRIEHDYRELKQDPGLAHFEARTWPGWYHHVTLVTAAQLFVTSQRLTAHPKAKGAA